MAKEATRKSTDPRSLIPDPYVTISPLRTSLFGKEPHIRRLHLTSQRWWPLLLLAIIAVGVSLTLIPQEDFWWHLKIGEWIRANGSIPRTGLYSATRAAAPMFYQSWGSEWLFAVLYDAGGLVLIALVRNLLLVATYGLLVWHTLRRTNDNGRATLVALLLAAAVAFDNWGVRPQTFSWLLFALMFVIVNEVSVERWPRRVLWALPLIEIVWVNLHGAFTLGPVLVGCAALGGTLDRRRDHPDAPTYPTARALWLALGGVILAMVVNPRGIGVITYVWTLLTDPSSQRLVSEWVSPFNTLDNPVTQLFFLALLIAVLMVAVGWQRLRTGDLLAFGAFTVLTLTGIRYQLWFGMVAGPIVAEALVRRGRLTLIKQKGASSPLLAWLTLAVTLLALIVQPPLRRFLLYPAALRGAQGPLANAELAVSATPVRAIDFLLANPPPGPLFHEMRYSSYQIWRAGEQLPTFVDTRVELYPIEQWFDYKCITAGRDWQPLLAKYGMTTVLADREFQKNLIVALQASGVWRERYSDERTIVLERDPAAPPPAQTATTCPADLAAEDAQ